MPPFRIMVPESQMREMVMSRIRDTRNGVGISIGEDRNAESKPLQTQRFAGLHAGCGARGARDRRPFRKSVRLTAKRSLVAVVSDGTAILGLGDLGAEASMPVMEGKAVLFKSFGDVDAWPVPLNHCRQGGANTGKTDPQRVIDAVLAIAPMYGGINLEDIAAPACFEIEDRLDELLDIPVFHDDQWGTAVITLSGLMNYALLSDRSMESLRVVINGAGAAGIRIADMCKAAGVQDLVMCDTRGVIHTARADLNAHKVGMRATVRRVAARGSARAHVFIAFRRRTR